MIDRPKKKKLPGWWIAAACACLAMCVFTVGFFTGRAGRKPEITVKAYSENVKIAAAADTDGAPSAPVNINTADAEELAKLPYIGEVIAQRIIDYRNGHGEFETVEEIKNVNGIGNGTYKKIEKYITTDG